jgi:histidyl-tRNA synthetase
MHLSITTRIYKRKVKKQLIQAERKGFRMALIKMQREKMKEKTMKVKKRKRGMTKKEIKKM